MRRTLVFLIFILFTLSILTSCRPPELEGAYVDYKAKRIDSAIELAKEATEKYPDNAEAPYLLGQIYGEKGEYQKMMDSFNKSLQRSEEFKEDIEQAKLYYFQSEYKKAYDSYVNYQNVAGDTSEKAMKMLTNAIEHAENAVAIKPNDYSTVKLAGLAANYKGDFDKAREMFKELTTIRPDTTDGWFQLGRLHFNEKNYEKAIEYNKKAFEVDSTFVPAMELTAFAYENLNDTTHAIQAYKKAIQLQPNNISYLFNLGLIYNKQASVAESEEVQKEKFAQAEEYFSRALNIDPEELEEFQRNLYDANLEILYSLTTVAQIQQRKFEEAKDTALEGIDYFPDSADLYEYLSISYSNLGEKDKAQEASDRAAQLSE